MAALKSCLFWKWLIFSIFLLCPIILYCLLDIVNECSGSYFFLPQRGNIFYFRNAIAWLYSDWRVSLRSWFECCPHVWILTWLAHSQACTQEPATDLGNISMQLILLTPCQSFFSGFPSVVSSVYAYSKLCAFFQARIFSCLIEF